MTRPGLVARDLRKVFGRPGNEVAAVDGVSFDLERGESLAIVGESGSGKTTTARMVAGLARPTAGDLLWDGSPLSDLGRRERARVVQMVFQDPFSSLNPRQRIAAAIDEVLKTHTSAGKSDRQLRAVELLGMVGLDDRHARELPRNLSGGQRQRVVIARALAMQPEVLILDEAVSALDVSVQAQVLNVLIELRRELDLTYIFVSHDLAVVRQISDRVLVMRDGLVVEQGMTRDVLDDPSHPYTRQLRDAVPRPGWRPRRRLPI